MTIDIRDADPIDGPALLALERISPEMGRAIVRVELGLDHFALAGRYPGPRGYVALAPDGHTIVGMLFASVAPTQLNGGCVSGAYLFSLRVHPAHRRRGIATALLTHAWERAQAEAGAEVAWGAVVPGNEASARTLQRCGFTQGRDLRVRLLLPGLLLRHGTPGLVCSRAAREDLPGLAEALNDRYVNHQFWRPQAADPLAAELAAVRHRVEDIVMVRGPEGRLFAAAVGLSLRRVMRLRLLGFRLLAGPVNRMVAPLGGLIPLRPLLVRRALLPADHPEAIAELLWALHRGSLPEAWFLAVTMDPADPAWPSIARMPGWTVRLRLFAKSERPIETARPWYFD